MKYFWDYLNTGDMVETAENAKRTSYILPTRRNAGHLAIVLVREVVAPLVLRNAEEETTDVMDLDGIRRVRATPSKFKFGERGRGLLVLRAYGVGGRSPQNRTAVTTQIPIQDAFDLNTFVFGDSAMSGTKVLPVKAAVQYSDALSTVPYIEAVGSGFHNRGDETGTLWDAETKANSSNLFTRHYVRPGTLLVQVLTSNGRQLTPMGLDHLLLSLGLAGSYGGQTSVTGTNVCTSIAGIFGARLESPLSSPYSLLRELQAEGKIDDQGVEPLVAAIGNALTAQYSTALSSAEATAYQLTLLEAFEQDTAWLRERYLVAAAQVSDMFTRYFG